MDDPQKNRLDALLAGADTLDTICHDVANGGSLIDLCETWDVSYGHVATWISRDPARSKAYAQAMLDRGEWAEEAILRELRSIGHVDIRRLYSPEGSLLAPELWPAEVARCVEKVQYKPDGTTIIGMVSKLRALELVMKKMGLLIQKVEHTGKVTLDQLVTQSMEDK